MQNKDFFLNSLQLINKLQESLSNIPDENIPSEIEIDIAKDKLRSIYNTLISWQFGIPYNNMEIPVEEKTINELQANDSRFDPDEKNPESDKVDTIIPEPVSEIESIEVNKPDVHTSAHEENTREEKHDAPTEIKKQKDDPFIKQSLKPESKPEADIPQLQMPEINKETHGISQPGAESVVETPNSVAKPKSTKKKAPVNQNGGKVIGEQLGADKKSLYDLISGTKGDKDIVSQFKKKPISNIHKAVSLNDKIWFTKELFDGNSENYLQTVDTINNSPTLDEAIEYITSNFSWDSDSRVVQKFLSIVSRRFI